MRLALVLVLLVLTVRGQAQDPPVFSSPELLGDGTVVFRYWAPSAKEVLLSGNWMGPEPPAALTKDAAGVWTAKAGPFGPNIYEYTFLVDGTRTLDPVCRCGLMWAGRFASSRFTVPGNPARSWERQNHPSGTLHHHRFFSKRQQLERGFVVYTPFGYETSGNRRYPVLLLTPGTPGHETDWTSGGGFAEVMFDNLIATGRMVPMLVVMHASDVLDRPGGRRGDENMRAFETIIVDELLPIVKQRYRAAADPGMWAIAGLSLGGEFGMHVGMKHPEQFRTLVSISSSFVANASPGNSGFETRYPLPTSAGTYRMIWVGSGTEDIFHNGAKAFVARLTANQVPHIFKEYKGAHVMPVFRQELDDVLPLLFK
jgi:enterochelin esterase family protein